MSFRNRLQRIAVGGCLIGACLWPLGLAGQESPQPNAPAPAPAPTPAPVTTPDASALRSLFEDWVRRSDQERAANAAAAQRSERLAEADFAVQQEMARWSFRIAAALALQLLLGVLLLLLVWRIARHGKRAANASVALAKSIQQSAADVREAFGKLERPYVFPDDLGQLRRVSAAHDITGGVQLKIGNHGKSPAVVGAVTVKFAVAQMPLTPEKLAAPNCEGKDVVARFPLSKTLLPGATHDLEVVAMPAGMKVLLQFEGAHARLQPGFQGEMFVVVRIEYEDAANGPRRSAQTVWHLGPEGFARYGGRPFNHETEIGETASAA